MKKILLFVSALTSAFAANAQLTQSNNAPAAGEIYTMYRCDSVSTVPGAAGANANWNFSSLATFTNLARNYSVSAVSTTTYPAANVGVASGINDASYLASSSASLAYYGGNIAAGAIVGNITYTSAAVNAIYPMNLNTSTTSVIGGSLFISALSLNGTFTGSSSVVADGTGTITLPGAVTFTNTMRVVTNQTIFVAASLANATITQVNYNYYVIGIKAPVLTISTSTAVVASLLGPSTTTQTAVSRLKNPTLTNPSTGIDNNGSNAESLSLSVFPNPSSSTINFSTTTRVSGSVCVYDLTGKLVEKTNFTEGKARVDVSSFQKGLYIYCIIAEDGKKLKSGKITVGE
ncbi:MAG: T9SS type A sorting domain-containing protein [Bacteroidia bacterium]|nr:T9SS type A sorting domain-containing protein [Bacteroidia bacterium]